MCGLAGFVEPNGFNPEYAHQIGLQMSQAIMHRGPDDFGIWLDSDSGTALIHRRLAIVDLSEAGHQPMISASGRYVLTFNGEIYNHSQLRAALEARIGSRKWNGRSDTETLLACIRKNTDLKKH